MAEWTSIALPTAIKDELEEHRGDDESWGAFFERWLAEEPPVDAQEEVLRELACIREELDGLPGRTADAVEGRLR